MKKMLALAILLGCAMLNACATYTAPVMPPCGSIYANVNAPIMVDYNKTEVAQKSGTATAQSILSMVSWGDASMNAAAQNGGLKTIEHADYHYYNILGLYQKFETIAYGN